MANTSPRASFRDPPQPLNLVDDDPERFKRIVNDTLNLILEGKINVGGSVTLTDSSATTTLNDRKIGIDSIILLQPTTTLAKDEGIPYVTGKGDGTCVLNHASNTNARTYDYVVLGA